VTSSAHPGQECFAALFRKREATGDSFHVALASFL
jgi:hypothetical protein